MYGRNPVTNSTSAVEKAVNPTVGGTHQAAVQELHSCIDMAEDLLVKVRGAQPQQGSASPEEMPSLLSSASRINQLAQSLSDRLRELHQAIGE